MEPTALASDASPEAEGAANAAVPRYRLYSLWQIFVVTCLCFVAGPILLARNYTRLRDARRAWITLLVGVPFFIGNVALVLYRPNGNVGGWLVPIGVFMGLIRKPYGAVYRAHVAAGGTREPWWKAVGIGALLAAAFGVALGLGHLFFGMPLPLE